MICYMKVEYAARSGIFTVDGLDGLGILVLVLLAPARADLDA